MTITPPFPPNTPAPIDPARIDANWRGITIELDAPRPSLIERLLRLLRFPSSVTRIMVATPSLRRSWYVAVGIVVLLGLVGSDSAQPRENLFTFLLLAPIVPALGVSMAYGVEADPAHEVGLATPLRGLSLLLTRASAVLVFSLLPLGLASLARTGVGFAMAAAWLIPSIALTSCTIALMSFLTPRRSLVLVLGAWAVPMIVLRAVTTDPLAAFGPPTQFALGLVISLAIGVMVKRGEHYDRLGNL